MLGAPGAGLCWSVPRQDGLNVNMQEFVLRLLNFGVVLCERGKCNGGDGGSMLQLYHYLGSTRGRTSRWGGESQLTYLAFVRLPWSFPVV